MSWRRMRGAGVERIVVVTSPSGEAVRAYAASLDCESMVQDRQLGTGHAAGAAQSALAGFRRHAGDRQWRHAAGDAGSDSANV